MRLHQRGRLQRNRLQRNRLQRSSLANMDIQKSIEYMSMYIKESKDALEKIIDDIDILAEDEYKGDDSFGVNINYLAGRIVKNAKTLEMMAQNFIDEGTRIAVDQYK